MPALWPDGEAAGLLAGTQTGRSRAELLATWRSDLEAINGRRRLHDPSSPELRGASGATTRPSSCRGSSLPGVGYAVLPFIDLANHDDAPNAKLRVDEAGGYCGVRAFGWLALGDDERPSWRAARSASRWPSVRGDLGEVKLGLLGAAPGGGRAVLTTTGTSDVDDRAHAGALRDLLCGLRLVSMDEAALTAEILENEAPEDSPWALGERVSDANEAAAVQAGSGLLRRMIAASDGVRERTKRASRRERVARGAAGRRSRARRPRASAPPSARSSPSSRAARSRAAGLGDGDDERGCPAASRHLRRIVCQWFKVGSIANFN
ncbi:hypothetical protein JL720_14951 [Aureococcus anophagefferens]|nr:hypothetical protein JL720_14951 [Aureococcus anophagefferens]